MKNKIAQFVSRHKVLMFAISFLADWGMIAIIGPGKNHSEPVHALLCLLGLMWVVLLFAIGVVGALAADTKGEND
jgi:hypothetical protein